VEVVLLDEGRPHVSPQELIQVELSGHGLNATAVAVAPELTEDLRRFQFQPEFHAGGGI